MGEVYRARDTRLERTVAIKVLPHHLSPNSDLKQRFEREARAISSLNHLRICILHDVGHPNTAGQQYSVTAEGQRFLQITTGDTGKGRLPVNCDSELDCAAPAQVVASSFQLILFNADNRSKHC